MKQYFKITSIFICLSLLAGLFFLFDVIYYHNSQYYYLLRNLLLAWIPLLLAFYLKKVLFKKTWSSYEAMLVSFLWLLFIPNSFYMLSDYVHLNNFTGNNLLFNITFFSEIIITALMIGFFSVKIVESEIENRFSKFWSKLIISLIFLLSSFGIYVGRDLRWNSWDILIKPGPLLLDVFYHLSNPFNYATILTVVLSFFTLIFSFYYLVTNFGQKFSKINNFKQNEK